jgi:quercetin dioxygenase-like cupin family protein
MIAPPRSRDRRHELESWDILALDVKPHHPEVLRSDGEARLIAIQLPAGEELQEHQVHERAYLLVAEGEIEIDDGGASETGGPGYVVCFDPNERREVRAKADSRLLLLLAPWPGEGHPRRAA